MLGVPEGKGVELAIGLELDAGVVDVEGELVKVGLIDGVKVGEGEALGFGRSGMMLRATSGITVATTMITMRMPASKPLLMPLPFPGGGGGGGG